MIPHLRIHTHCQVAQKSQRTYQNLSKSMAALTHGLTEGIKHENTTSGNTQLPGCAVANVRSLATLGGNTTRKLT